MIGRKKEQDRIMECIQADRSRLIVVYGRRRVGKTFLIRESFDYKFTFTHTGLEKGGYREQLSEFWHSLKRQWKADCRMPSSWSDAFELLKDNLHRRATVDGYAEFRLSQRG